MPGESKPLELRAILFDVDGTLIDSLQAIILGIQDTFLEFGMSVPTEAEVRAKIGIPLKTQLPMYRSEPISPEIHEQMGQFAISRFHAYGILERPFSPAVQGLIMAKKRGLKTALVTSKSHAELAGFFDKFDFIDYVDAVVSASDVTHPKPAADSALLACERLAVLPQHSLFVGDSIFDIQCGKSAGTLTAAVGYGAGQRADLLAHSPDLYFDTPDDLLEWARSFQPDFSCPASH